EVRLLGQRLLVAVRDDGCGGASLDAGGGLAGLADRVTAVGGTLRVDSPPGKGTRLEASITLAPWRSAREPFLEFGHADDGGLGERLLEMVLDQRKTVSMALAREWDLEGGPPRPGQRIPVLDATGAKRAMVEVDRVTVVSFIDIDHRTLEASQEGEWASVEDWRATQRAFYDSCREEVALLLGEPGWRLTDDEPMVVTWFTRVE
ncbi:MAG TPA: ASCH domain-containing protein, partial [Solirubrobacteraceae bacterium]|nr:ASCH domain-containing protein [Solirubrobacteraceae bacterium]